MVHNLVEKTTVAKLVENFKYVWNSKVCRYLRVDLPCQLHIFQPLASRRFVSNPRAQSISPFQFPSHHFIIITARPWFFFLSPPVIILFSIPRLDKGSSVNMEMCLGAWLYSHFVSVRNASLSTLSSISVALTRFIHSWRPKFDGQRPASAC